MTSDPERSRRTRWTIFRMLPRASAPDARGDVRGERVCLLLIVLLSALLWCTRLRGPIDLRWDGGVYWLLGTSIMSGQGYRLLNEPGSVQALQYPPGLPAAVALFQWLFGSAGKHDTLAVAHALRLAFVGIWTAYLAGAFFMARRWFSPRWSFVCTLILALQLDQLILSDRCFAEMPFTLLSFLFVQLNWRAERPWLTVAQWGSGAAAFLFRTAGIALFAAWVFEALVRRKLRLALGRGALAAVVVLGWQAYVWHVETSAEYRHPAYAYQRASYIQYNVKYTDNALMVDPDLPEMGSVTAGGFVRRFFRNWLRVPQTIGAAVSVPRPREAPLTRAGPTLQTIRSQTLRFFLISLGLLTLVGFWALARRGEWLIVAYVAAGISLFCVTPFVAEFRRYAVPLAPYFVPALLLGLLDARRVLASRWPPFRALAPGLLPGVVAIILAVQIPRTVDLYRRRAFASVSDDDGKSYVYALFNYDKSWVAFEGALRWLKASAQPEEVVVTKAAHWTYLQTGLKSVWPPQAESPAELEALLDSVPARYLIIDNFRWTGTPRRMHLMLSSRQQLWRPVFSDPNSRLAIYRRQP